jgi:hypothetical protein
VGEAYCLTGYGISDVEQMLNIPNIYGVLSGNNVFIGKIKKVALIYQTR